MQLPTTKPPLRSILWAFVRHGNVTFGGGSATIAELERELVEHRQWINHDQSRLSYALSRITPGTNLLAYCVGVGWLLRGAFGSMMSLIGASVPCSVLVVFLTILYEWWSHSSFLGAAMRGAFVAAVAVTIATGWTLIRPYNNSVSWPRIVFGACGSLALAWLGVTPLIVLLVAAIVGFVWPGESAKP